MVLLLLLLLLLLLPAEYEPLMRKFLAFKLLYRS
jgi:hypothetical protein